MIAQYSYAYDSQDAEAFAQRCVEDGLFEIFVPGQTRPLVSLQVRANLADPCRRRSSGRRRGCHGAVLDRRRSTHRARAPWPPPSPNDSTSGSASTPCASPVNTSSSSAKGRTRERAPRPTVGKRSQSTSRSDERAMMRIVDGPAAGATVRDGGPPPAEDRPRSSGAYIPRSRRGSSASRSQSPTMLMPSTSNRMARPGKRASHHPVVR